MANLTINGKSINVDVENDTPLLWAIRENVGLTGTKYGCGIAQCGACTIHLGDTAIRSCQLPVSSVGDKAITTIEGLSEKGDHPVQKAWLEHDVAQCGACTVHVDGVAMRSCGVTVSEAIGKQITTIEGLASNGALHKVQLAWVANDVPQCGYCQSGMIMAVAALLKEKPKPTDQDINDAITNICR